MLKNLKLNKKIKEWPGIEPLASQARKTYLIQYVHREDKMLNTVFWLQFEETNSWKPEEN